MRNILIVPSDGFGNSVLCGCVYMNIVRALGKTDVYLKEESIAKPFWQEVTKSYGAKVLVNCEKKLQNYRVFAIGKGDEQRLNISVSSLRTRIVNEAKDNELLLEHLGITPKYEHFSWRKNNQPKYDVVICNGSKNKYTYLKKRYRRWNEVVSALKNKGLTVASVGLPDEYIPGTDDKTYLTLMQTMDLISNCKVFASNDAGLYHFACFIGVAVVVAVTASNLSKIYDPDFHSTASMITPDLECAPCHGLPNNVWMIQANWDKCKNWKCAEYDSVVVTQEIMKRLKEG